MTSTFTTYLELNLLGHAGPRSQAELTVHYCHNKASGDDFYEQHWSESVSIEKVIHEQSGMDVLPLLKSLEEQLEVLAMEIEHEGEFA